MFEGGFAARSRGLSSGRALMGVAAALVVLALAGAGLVHSGGARAAAVSSYTQAVLADQPTAYWHLGEASGAFADSSTTPGGHPASATGGADFFRDQPGVFDDDHAILDTAAPSGYGLSPPGGVA